MMLNVTKTKINCNLKGYSYKELDLCGFQDKQITLIYILDIN